MASRAAEEQRQSFGGIASIGGRAELQRRRVDLERAELRWRCLPLRRRLDFASWEILPRIVGDDQFCVSDISTMRDANERMYPAFCLA